MSVHNSVLRFSCLILRKSFSSLPSLHTYFLKLSVQSLREDGSVLDILQGFSGQDSIFSFVSSHEEFILLKVQK